MMTIDELLRWCSKDKMCPNLHRPFTRDGKTYATNGHVMIILDGVVDGAEGDGVDVDRVISKLSFDGLTPVSIKKINPEYTPIDCCRCDGTGKGHLDCPDCCCECDVCDGTGKKEDQVYVTLRGGYFNAKYTNMLADLPGLRMPTECQNDDAIPVAFEFSGGRGAIMRCRWRGDVRVVEIAS